LVSVASVDASVSKPLVEVAHGCAGVAMGLAGKKLISCGCPATERKLFEI
jgi:hypothetical protein